MEKVFYAKQGEEICTLPRGRGFPSDKGHIGDLLIQEGSSSPGKSIGKGKA